MRQTDRHQDDKQTHQQASNRTERLAQLRRDLHEIAMSVARARMTLLDIDVRGDVEEGH
jgi:hypothetical protein